MYTFVLYELKTKLLFHMMGRMMFRQPHEVVLKVTLFQNIAQQ